MQREPRARLWLFSDLREFLLWTLAREIFEVPDLAVHNHANSGGVDGWFFRVDVPTDDDAIALHLIGMHGNRCKRHQADPFLALDIAMANTHCPRCLAIKGGSGGKTAERDQRSNDRGKGRCGDCLHGSIPSHFEISGFFLPVRA